VGWGCVDFIEVTTTKPHSGSKKEKRHMSGWAVMSLWSLIGHV
jgi:hypothetical protein